MTSPIPPEAWADVEVAAARYDELAEQGVDLRFDLAGDRVAIGRLPANHDVCPLDCCPAPAARPAGRPA